MKEIIYIQAGPLANYTGTHFWNTQESYFTYGSDDDGEQEEPLVTNDISFREVLTNKNDPILCPRLLVFDRKANFGTLSKDSIVGQEDGDHENITLPPLWGGEVAEYRQAPIQKSQYHDQIEQDGDVDAADDYVEPEIRYWSDFNRLYYTPKTVQKLPDVADWENAEGNWDDGKELFRRYDEETALMEDSLRNFAEECDSLQGMQLTYDTATFGSFTDSFLTSFRDEFSKLSILSFPLLSEAISKPLDLDDNRGRRKALNDSLCLRSMNELVSMSVPIQSPQTWPRVAFDGKQIDPESKYHTSALLSAHIENATLPMRLRGTHEGISSFTSHLNWRGITHFAELSSLIIDSSGLDFDERMSNYSSLDSARTRDALEFTRRDVTRGFTLPRVAAYEKWCAEGPLRTPFLSSTHAPPYPLPTSFPPIFTPRDAEFRTRSIPLFTSLMTTPRTSSLFRRYARFVEANLDFGSVSGLDRDEMKELSNNLWGICDGYDDTDTGGDADVGNEYGEDEE